MERISIKNSVGTIWISLIILSIFFPIRYVFLTNSAYVLGFYSDFTSLSVYLSDFLILAGAIYASIVYKKEYFKKFSNFYLLCFVLWVAVALLVNFYDNPVLHLYIFARFIELIVLYGTVQIFFNSAKINKSYYIFIILSVIQVIISLIQFSLQKNIGLKYVGESIIGQAHPVVARILAEGLVFIRPYGTFPHPNVLSAVLVTGFIVSLAMHFLFSQSKRAKYLLIFGNSIILVGIIFTFSRAAYLSTAIGSFVWYCLLILRKHLVIKYHVGMIFSTLILTIITITILNQLIVVRAQVFDDANKERAIYNNIGLEIVKKQPIFGTGIGTSLLHMELDSRKPLESWQKQPIHNYFLLQMAENGIIGFLLFMGFIGALIYKLYKRLWSIAHYGSESPNPVYLGLSLSLLASFLTLMLFDHYFYTIPQTQLLLWLILGISFSLISSTKETPQIISKKPSK